MSEEIKELVVGIDLNTAYGRITYWHRFVGDPVTLSTGDDTLQLPGGLVQEADGNWALQEGYLRMCFDTLHEQIRDVFPEEGFGTTKLYVMITVKQLTEQLNALLIDALLQLGIDRDKIYIQDYLSSFYYYTVNQKQELWSQDAALLTWEEESIVGYVLHIDRSKKPAVAQADQIARQPMDETVRGLFTDEQWDQERDRLFFELLKKVFERRSVSVSYLMGDYFDEGWANRSIQYLCAGRHAFQGMNLYSKGACYAAMERAKLLPGREIIFNGIDMVDRNLGMEMLVRGKETFYPLVNAGVNWYEVHEECEFILRDEREVQLISRPANPGEATVHILRLPGLPERPPRATRLRLKLYYTSPTRCHMECEDLGFGGLYKSSGLCWSRNIEF